MLSGPAALLDLVRRRAQLGQATETGRITSLVPSVDQRRELGLLLGTDWVTSGRPVRLEKLAQCLAEHELTVRALLEAVHGPIELDADVRRQALETAAAERLEASLELARAGVPQGVAADWLTNDPMLPQSGSGELLSIVWEVAAVWSSLPGGEAPPVRLAQFAGVNLDDAHALDADRLLGRLIARLAAAVRGLERPVRGGKAWRLAWASVGVLCDEVSSRVLVLNLPLAGGTHAARLCQQSPGEPVWLSLRSLRGEWSATATTVFVCENPTVVEAAADALGDNCPPLVCTDGIATTAALDLIAGLAVGGCHLWIRADFDQAGLVIMNQLRTAAPEAKPWRFDTSTYAALTNAALDPQRELSEVLTTSVHEEVLLETLLGDLVERVQT
ncbi:DUF2399 domain-containing protein [Kribbella sp. NPDC059898]|uniref:DUF2399 domain-containing protein n=1 Tax=Kribbella sp. NPDC059898 TaxID=3346995 RepID=UPI003660DA3D